MTDDELDVETVTVLAADKRWRVIGPAVDHINGAPELAHRLGFVVEAHLLGRTTTAVVYLLPAVNGVQMLSLGWFGIDRRQHLQVIAAPDGRVAVIVSPMLPRRTSTLEQALQGPS